MAHELLNLLPLERSRAWRREYFIRLAVIALWLLAGTTVAAGVLLLPVYLAVADDIRAQENRIAALDATLSATKGQETNQRLSALAQNATYLARLKDAPTATEALTAILALPHAGVSLTGFTYAAAAAKTPGKMTLSGIATTRESLRAYVAALASLPFIANADLPIGAYAKESDIPFTIILTGKPSTH